MYGRCMLMWRISWCDYRRYVRLWFSSLSFVHHHRLSTDQDVQEHHRRDGCDSLPVAQWPWHGWDLAWTWRRMAHEYWRLASVYNQHQHSTNNVYQHLASMYDRHRCFASMYDYYLWCSIATNVSPVSSTPTNVSTACTTSANVSGTNVPPTTLTWCWKLVTHKCVFHSFVDHDHHRSYAVLVGHMQFLYTWVHGQRDGCDRLPVVLLDRVGQELGADHCVDAIGVDWHLRFWVCSQRDGHDGLPISLAFPCTRDPDLWGGGGVGRVWREVEAVVQLAMSTYQVREIMTDNNDNNNDHDNELWRWR